MRARWHTLVSVSVPFVAGFFAAHGAGCSGSDSGTSGTSTDSGITQGDGTSEGDALDGDAVVDETSSETAPICPPNGNPSGCPDHYFAIPKGEACSPVGLTCRYYGEGDEPCPSYAACTCDVPTGADGGTATWTHCVQ